MGVNHSGEKLAYQIKMQQEDLIRRRDQSNPCQIKMYQEDLIRRRDQSNPCQIKMQQEDLIRRRDQSNPCQIKMQQEDLIRRRDQSNPQQQQSQKIEIDQQNIQYNSKGNDDKKARINAFDYEQFILLMQQTLQKKQENYEENSLQQLLNQSRCMQVNHNKKFIEGICVNVECKAGNRRMCFDCIIQGNHNKDQNEQTLSYNQPLNADQLNNVIKDYKLFLNKQVDYFEYFFNFEQLGLTNENNMSCIQIQELQKIENKIKCLKEINEQIKIEGYIEQQHSTNIGLFNYFLSYYQEINIINQNIEEYKKLKSETKNSLDVEYVIKNINKVKIEMNHVEKLNQQKKKHFIIHKLIETSQYQNKEIDEKDILFIKSQIAEVCDLGKVFQQQQQYELAIQCYELSIKSNPSDPLNSDYYYNIGQKNYYEIGKCLRKLQRYQEANKAFEKFYNGGAKKGQINHKVGEYNKLQQP